MTDIEVTGGAAATIEVTEGPPTVVEVMDGTPAMIDVIGGGLRGPAGADGAGGVASVVAGTNITVDNTDPANPIVAATASGGAPTGADYLVGTSQGGLSAEIVVGTAPGGELGGTWAAPTVDSVHSGSSHAATQAAAETTAATALAGHVAAGDPHPVYLTAAEGDAAYQPLDGDLSAIAALATTSYGRAFLALANAAAALAALGLDADLATLSLPASTTISAFIATLLDDADAATARTTLGLGTAATSASTDFQPIDSDLTAIAALATTSFGRSLLTTADAAALRVAAGTVIGTNVQAWDADLDTIAGLTATTNNVIQSVAGAWASRTPAQLLATLSGASGADFSLNSHKLTAVSDGSAVDDVATVGQVTNLINGRPVKLECRAATTTALPTVVYANGASGVGATLTGASVGALSAQDGVSMAVGDRLLVKNQVAPEQNGCYTVTIIGSGIAVFVLTRATDSDQAADLQNGASYYVVLGTTLTDTTWALSNDPDTTITMGTTALPFAQVDGPGSTVAGNGLARSGSTLSIDTAITVDKTTAQTLTNKTLTSPVINTPTGIVKGDVGLGNVDNTSNVTERAAAATLTNKTLTSPVVNSPTGIVKGDVGLGNVDNTSNATERAASATLTNKKLSDTTTTVVNAADATKVAKIDLSGATTGKTATLAIPVTNDRTITLPDATDTLVGKATTDTLTNKTIGVSQLSGQVAIANGGTASSTAAAARTALGLDTGWLADTNTWTYASATTFTIAADATGYLFKGNKVSYNDGAVDYGIIAAVAFAAGTTTVTLITNTDYTIANAALTAPRYSYAESPQGFPTWFNWSPTLSGWSANPTSVVYRYSCYGTAIVYSVRQGANGTSNNATHTATLPVTAATVTGGFWLNTCVATDNNVVQAGSLTIGSAATTMSLNGILATSNNTNSGNSRINGGTLPAEF